MMGLTITKDVATISYRKPQATPLVDFWRVPINRPANAADLSQPNIGGDSITVVGLETAAKAAVGVIAGDENRIPSERYCEMGGFVYSPAAGGASTAIVTGVAQANCVTKFSEAAGGNRLLNGPIFVQDVFSHYGRVWVAAARDPGGANYDPSGLYYTIPGGTVGVTDNVADWSDPISGELNRFQIGGAIDGDFNVGLGRAGGHLVIFKRRSIWVLYGTDPANFTLRQLRTKHGCIDARSICTYDDGVYFASQAGFERFDGTRFTLLSDPVADSWLEFSNRGPAASTVNHSYIRVTALPNGYLYVVLGSDPYVANGTDGAERGWLYYAPTGAWSQLVTAVSTLGLSAAGAFGRIIPSPNTITVWGASKWARADLLTFGPSSVGVCDRDGAGAAAYSIDLLWTTAVNNMGSYRGTDGRWSTNTLQHATADYHHHYTNSTPPQLDAFGTLLATDGFGAALAPAQDVPGYQPAGPLRVRQMFDMNHESNRGDASFTLQSTIGSSSSKRTADLRVFGLGVAFQHGRERHVA